MTGGCQKKMSEKFCFGGTFLNLKTGGMRICIRYMIFKYNSRANAFSMIQAEYLLKNQIQDKNVFLFLAKNSEAD